jgi:signal transduction histidine kinase
VACHDAVVTITQRPVAAARAGCVLLGVAGAGFGLLTLAEARSAPGGSFAGTSWLGAVAELAAGWSLIAAGVAECLRRAARRAGLLLIAAGIGWFFAEWNNSGLGSPAFTFGLIVSALAPPLVAHAALAYPAGRLASRLDRGVVLVAYAGAGLVLGLLPAVVFDPQRQACGLCPANLVLIRSEPGLVSGLQRAGLVVGLAWTAGLAAVGARRLVKASPPLRRMIWPVLAAAGGYVVLAGADFAHSLPRGTLSNDPLEHRLWFGEAAFLVLMALGVFWAWVRDRRTRSAVVRLVMDTDETLPLGRLRNALSGILRDEDLELAYPVGNPARHVDVNGQPVSLGPSEGQMVTPLIRAGQTMAVMRHRAGLLDDPGLVREVTSAAGLAIDNERLHAEVRAQLMDLQASQARIVATGDTERRRLERDLHDGAQQRLVGLSLALRLARSRSSPGSVAVTGLIEQADRELQLAIDELRTLAHGIYPAVLADEGLGAAVEALADRSTVPITIGDLPQERLPGPVEAAGYFLIAEMAGAVSAPAGAGGVTVNGKHAGDRLVIEITGETAAWAAPVLETGLTSAADRVGALGGHLRVGQAARDVILIRAEIPCGS